MAMFAYTHPVRTKLDTALSCPFDWLLGPPASSVLTFRIETVTLPLWSCRSSRFSDKAMPATLKELASACFWSLMFVTLRVFRGKDNLVVITSGSAFPFFKKRILKLFPTFTKASFMSAKKDQDDTTTKDVKSSFTDMQQASCAGFVPDDQKDEKMTPYATGPEKNCFEPDHLDKKHVESHRQKERYQVGTVIDFMNDWDNTWRTGHISGVWSGFYWVKMGNNQEVLVSHHDRTRVHGGGEIPKRTVIDIGQRAEYVHNGFWRPCVIDKQHISDGRISYNVVIDHRTFELFPFECVRAV